jgi:hypothetical protein
MRVWLVILDSLLGARQPMIADTQQAGLWYFHLGRFLLGANSCQKDQSRSEPPIRVHPYPSLLIYLELWLLNIKVLLK